MTSAELEEMGSSAVYTAFMLILCITAVFLNVLVVIVVVRYGQYRASIDIFLTNLAASDILHAGVVVPIHLKKTASYHTDFYGDDHVCKLVMMIPLVSIMAAILTMVAMAIDRYRAIVTHKTIYRSGALKTIVIIWILSFIVSSPQIYEYNVYRFTEFEDGVNVTFTSCGSEGIAENFEKIYASLVLILAYCIPLAVLIISYFRIMAYVWKNSRRFRNTAIQTVSTVDRSGSGFNPQRRVNAAVSERSYKVLKMLIFITASFTILWTPYFIIFAMTEVTGKDDIASFGEWSHITGRAMSTVSTITNPVIYLFCSQTFRRLISDFMFWLCCRPRRVGPLPLNAMLNGSTVRDNNTKSTQN